MRAHRTSPRDAVLRYWREQMRRDELTDLDRAQRAQDHEAPGGGLLGTEGTADHDPRAKTGALGKRQSAAGGRIDPDQLGQMLEAQDGRTAERRRSFRRHQADQVASSRDTHEIAEKHAQPLGPVQREPQNTLIQTLAEVRKSRVRAQRTVEKKRGSERPYAELPHAGPLLKTSSGASKLGPQRAMPHRPHAQDGLRGTVAIE